MKTNISLILLFLFPFFSFSQVESGKIPEEVSVLDVLQQGDNLWVITAESGSIGALYLKDGNDWLKKDTIQYAFLEDWRNSALLIPKSNGEGFFVEFPYSFATKLYSYDQNGDRIWTKELGLNDYSVMISNGLEMEGVLTLVGGSFDSEFAVNPLYMKVDSESGEIIDQQVESIENHEAFYSQVLYFQDHETILGTQFNPENANVDVFLLRRSDVTYGRTLLPMTGRIGVNMVPRGDDLLLLNYGDGIGYYSVYDVQANQLNKDVVVFDAFDDLPMYGFLVNGNFVVVNTTWPRGDEVYGSGVVILVSTFDQNDEFVKRTYVSDNPNEENICNGAYQLDSGLLVVGDSYVNGEDFTQAMWHFFPNDRVVDSKFRKELNKELLFSDGEFRISDQTKIQRMQIISFDGKVLEEKEVNADFFTISSSIRPRVVRVFLDNSYLQKVISY